MADERHPISRFAQPRAPGVHLDSWKQIAAYLKRHVTTVRRWESHEGLPVHRHFHAKLGSVYAKSSELDAWLQTRRPDRFAGPTPKRVFAPAEVVPFEGSSLPAALPSWSGPFIGRAAELATLTRAWEAARTGRGQLILIVGEPGIGKTRLAIEFARGIGDQATVLRGHCDQEALVPFAPFCEVLRRLARSTPALALRHRLKNIDGSCELVQLLPELAKGISGRRPAVAATPEGRRFRMFDAFAEHLIAAAHSQPLLVLLEDMHWAEHGSLILLRHLARSTGSSPICLIVTARHPETDVTPAAREILSELRREPSYTGLALDKLTDQCVRDLVVATAGSETPDWVAEAVAARACGNPLFVIDLATHLAQSNSPTAAIDRDVPETIRELIDRRLRRLNPDTQTVVALASIIGSEFDLSVLSGLDRVAEAAAIDALDEAAAAKIIVEDPQVPGRFSFAHALIRDVLCGRMTAARRVRLHHEIACAIERQSAHDLPLQDLAYHFGQAASFRDADKAVEYACRAGDSATASFAMEAAARHYEAALRCMDRVVSGQDLQNRRAELQTKRGRSYFQAGQWASAKAAFEAALAVMPASGDAQRCQVLVNLAETSFWLMNVPDVRRFAASAHTLAERLDRSDLAADALAWLASAKVAEGDVGGGIALDRAALARAGGVRSFGLARAPLTLYWAGRCSESVNQASQGVEWARAANDPAFLLYALQHLGLGLCSVGRYDESLHAFEEARQVGRRSGALPLLARAISMSAAPLMSLGDLDNAAARAHEARALAHRVAFEPPVVSAGIDLLVIFARKHDLDGVQPLLDEIDAAVKVAQGWHAWKWKLRLCHARSELAFAHQQWAEAIHEANQVVEQSRPRMRLKYEALALATRAVAERRLRKQAARSSARAAMDAAARLGDPAVRLRCLTASLDVERTGDILQEARSTVQQMLAGISDDRLRQIFLDGVNVWAADAGVSLTADGS